MAGTGKITVCFLLIFFSFSSIQAQDVYFVTFVKGDIKKNNAAKIRVGDRLQVNETVTFSTKDCRLILLHPQKGRFVVEPGTVTEKPSGEYSGYIKNNLLPDFKKVNLSSRGSAGLEAYFRADPAIRDNLLFIGDSRVSIDTNRYLIKDPAHDFFFLQHTTASGKTFMNKLATRQDKLVIRKQDLLFEGKKLPETEELLVGFVQNYSTQKKIRDIAYFKQAYMSLSDCKKIMRAVKKALGKNRDTVIDETYTLLYYNYGKPDKTILSAIYDRL